MYYDYYDKKYVKLWKEINEEIEKLWAKNEKNMTDKDNMHK